MHDPAISLGVSTRTSYLKNSWAGKSLTYSRKNKIHKPSSLIKGVVPSKKLSRVKILINCKEDYNGSKSDYKREEGLSGSLLCLRLGSLCVDGE